MNFGVPVSELLEAPNIPDAYRFHFISETITLADMDLT